jgi:hypothetical protein
LQVNCGSQCEQQNTSAPYDEFKSLGATSLQGQVAVDDLLDWAEAHVQIARMTLTIKLDRHWSSLQFADRAPDSVIAPSARMLVDWEARLHAYAKTFTVSKQTHGIMASRCARLRTFLDEHCAR